MVEIIYDLKNQLLDDMEREVKERGIERLDKEKVDMVKDLAKAEKDCWEAEYYRSVAEAMEGESGYGTSGAQMGMSGAQMGYNGMSGAQQGSRGGRSGAQGGSRGRSGRSRRGYDNGYQEHLNALREQMRNMEPQERERVMQELRGM